MDSKLQIISGRFHGRKLTLPPDARPTQNRARIALFNMLESGLVDFERKFTVWDAFAGSGAFGLECVSRYPGATVIFTDVSDTSIRTVRRNLNTLGVDATARTDQVDAMAVITRYGAVADLVFLDPPYANADMGAVFVHKLARVAQAGTVLVWEQDAANSVLPDENAWEILRDKKYGRARFLILKRKNG